MTTGEDIFITDNLKELLKRKDSDAMKNPTEGINHINRPELIGSTKHGNSMGFIIPNLAPGLHELLPSQFDYSSKYRSLGILTSRSGAGPQLYAADLAVKMCNAEILMCDLSNDAEGGATHGSMTILGAEIVDDVRKAIEIMLDRLQYTFGCVWANDYGYIELQYTANAGKVLEEYCAAPLGKPCGLIAIGPAGVGLPVADACLKAAELEVLQYATPTYNIDAFPNEFSMTFTGDSDAVKQGLYAARDMFRDLTIEHGGESARDEDSIEYF